MDWENPKSVLKALRLLYSFQTLDEQQRKTTSHDNGVGFNFHDSTILSDIAEQLFVRKAGISQKQYDVVRNRLPKYRGQIEAHDLSLIELPPTAIIYDREKPPEKSAGLLYFENNILYFKPAIYPTSAVKQHGFFWDSSGRRWRSSLNPSNIRVVRELYPTVQLSVELEEWLEQKLKPTIWEPTGAGEDLFSYQREAVSHALHAKRSMVGLSPGLGKTAVAIMAAQEAGGNTLVIAPLSLVRNWQKEIRRWVGDDSVVWHGLATTAQKWVITNYETVLNSMVTYDVKTVRKKSGKTEKRRFNWRPIREFDFDNVIIDESILVKSRNAQRTHAAKAIAVRAANVWLLSGSPVSKFLDDMWSQLNIIDPLRFSSYWRFAEKYCVVIQNRWGWQITGNQPGAEEKLKKDLADIYFARTQEQVLDIPDWIFEDIEVEMSPEQYRLYKEMEDEFLATLPDGDVVVAPIVLTQLLRLVQFASNPALLGGHNVGAKWDALPELLEFVQLPAIIWVNFIETGNQLYNQLSQSYRVGRLTGDVKSLDRQAVVDQFQDGELDILIAHPAVGKFGHTLTAGRTSIYLERDYNGDNYYQSLHRTKRIGTKHSPHVIHLLAARPGSNEPTVDHVIHRILQFRKDQSLQITTGEIRELFQER